MNDVSDPLVEFEGRWNLDLASEYLPIPGLPVSKYECWDGQLFMTPPGPVGHGLGKSELAASLYHGAKAAGLYLCGRMRLPLGRDDRWIVPDLSVLDRAPGEIDVLAECCVMAVEFISPNTFHRPKVCAEYGIPWFLTVDLRWGPRRAVVELSKLVNRQYEQAVRAEMGQRFEMTQPFAASFDPIQLFARKPE